MKSLSKKSRAQPRQRHHPLLFLLAVALVGVGYQQIQDFFVQPEAIVVLGGHEDRERFAAQLAQQHPQLPIWVSSGSPQAYVQQIFAQAGISPERLYLDYRALDTVTNFTTLVDKLKAQGITSVYLITSDNHMRRARLVGKIIFGSQGIALKPVSVPSQASPESVQKCLRDGARAILWIATGHTGVSLRAWTAR
ncbi:MAG: YdcF family protein [Cyanophyceae cyanobacterium]